METDRVDSVQWVKRNQWSDSFFYRCKERDSHPAQMHPSTHLHQCVRQCVTFGFWSDQESRRYIQRSDPVTTWLITLIRGGSWLDLWLVKCELAAEVSIWIPIWLRCSLVILHQSFSRSLIYDIGMAHLSGKVMKAASVVDWGGQEGSDFGVPFTLRLPLLNFAHL